MEKQIQQMMPRMMKPIKTMETMIVTRARAMSRMKQQRGGRYQSKE
jgi:hypothetical protein